MTSFQSTLPAAAIASWFSTACAAQVAAAAMPPARDSAAARVPPAPGSAGTPANAPPPSPDAGR